MQISYITLGCKLNYAETSTYERRLSAEGFESVPWSKGAEVFLVNTCTFSHYHLSKSPLSIVISLKKLETLSVVFSHINFVVLRETNYRHKKMLSCGEIN